jgi:hypothetical protein
MPARRSCSSSPLLLVVVGLAARTCSWLANARSPLARPALVQLPATQQLLDEIFMFPDWSVLTMPGGVDGGGHAGDRRERSRRC